MTTPFAIRGLGRIGRALTRIAIERPGLELVAVADLAPVPSLAHLLAHDSVHGAPGLEVRPSNGDLLIGDRRIRVFDQPDAAEIPWRSAGAEIVVDATGLATARSEAARHLDSGRATSPRTGVVGAPGAGSEMMGPWEGARKVLVSAIALGADFMACVGINHEGYDPAKHHVVSNASCTTNCLALMVHVLHRRFGVLQAMMNEVHSYTGNQCLVDGYHMDLRRARAAAVNIVPTTTAAPAATEALIPELKGRLSGLAVRVPTPDVALLDLVVRLERPVAPEAINDAFREAAEGELAGLLAVEARPLVSSDFVGNPHSAVVDLGLTQKVGDDLFRIVAWYDNEWGYAHRLADMLTLIGERL